MKNVYVHAGSAQFTTPILITDRLVSMIRPPMVRHPSSASLLAVGRRPRNLYVRCYCTICHPSTNNSFVSMFHWLAQALLAGERLAGGHQ